MPHPAVAVNPRPPAALLALLVAALATGCAARAAPGPSSPSPLARVDGRLDLDGRPVALSGREGIEATVVVFFATWCQPCRRELALLGELRPRFPTVHIVGLNAYEEWGQRSDQQRMRGFLAESAPWLEVVPQADDLLDAFGGVPKIPTVLVFDRAGRAVAEFRRSQRPPPELAELEAALRAAIAN